MLMADIMQIALFYCNGIHFKLVLVMLWKCFCVRSNKHFCCDFNVKVAWTVILIFVH